MVGDSYPKVEGLGGKAREWEATGNRAFPGAKIIPVTNRKRLPACAAYNTYILVLARRINGLGLILSGILAAWGLVLLRIVRNRFVVGRLHLLEGCDQF